MGLDEAVLEGITQLEEFSGRRLIVLAALGGPHYLVSTDVDTRENTIYVVVDDREIGKIVTKFYWDMTHYWRTFRNNIPNVSRATDVLARCCVGLSPQRQFVVILGPVELCEEFRPKFDAPLQVKLLRTNCWKAEVSSVNSTWQGGVTETLLL